jgi:hypothetical protein
MTAINLIVQEQAVHLLTDAAFYDPEGVVLYIASKTVMMPALRLAIACSGRAETKQIADRLRGLSSQREMLQQLPLIAGVIRADNLALRPDMPEAIELQLFVAMWDERENRPVGLALSTDRAYFGDAYTPGVLVEVEQLFAPAVDLQSALGRRADPRRRFSFDPVQDGLRLIEGQRASKSAMIEDRWWIGGRAELITVDHEGVRTEILREWPDEVGGYITPVAEPASSNPAR